MWLIHIHPVTKQRRVNLLVIPPPTRSLNGGTIFQQKCLSFFFHNLVTTPIKIWVPKAQVSVNFGSIFHFAGALLEWTKILPIWKRTIKPETFLRLPDSKRMVYFGLPSNTWSQLIHIHSVICFPVFSQSDSLDGATWAEVFRLVEVASS